MLLNLTGWAFNTEKSRLGWITGWGCLWFMLQRQHLLMEISMALFCHPHYSDKAVEGVGGHRRTPSYNLQSANSPSLGVQPWGKVSFKQTGIFWTKYTNTRVKQTVHKPTTYHTLFPLSISFFLLSPLSFKVEMCVAKFVVLVHPLGIKTTTNKLLPLIPSDY